MSERKAKRRAIRRGGEEEEEVGEEFGRGRSRAPSVENRNFDLFPPSFSSSISFSPPSSQLESATTTSRGALLPRAIAAAALVAQPEAEAAAAEGEERGEGEGEGEEEEEVEGEGEELLFEERQQLSTSAFPEPAGSIASGILLAASSESPLSALVISPWRSSAAVPSPPTATSAPTREGSASAAALLAAPFSRVTTTCSTRTPAASSMGSSRFSKSVGPFPPPATGLMTTSAERGRFGSEGSWLSHGAAAARILDTISLVVGFVFVISGFLSFLFSDEEELVEERGEEEGGGKKTGRRGGRRPREAEKGAKEDFDEDEDGDEDGEEGFGGGGSSRAPTRSEASTS